MKVVKQYLRSISLFIALLIISLNVSVGNVQAYESDSLSKLNDLQEKVAKGYTDKFCNSIGMGISQEGATKLSINENKQSRFNPSLWLELASSGKENIDKIDKDELARVISEGIVRSCGTAIGLSGKKGVEIFQEYFNSIRAELELD